VRLATQKLLRFEPPSGTLQRQVDAETHLFSLELIVGELTRPGDRVTYDHQSGKSQIEQIALAGPTVS
jgi:hypothetical protein